jgi:hypothetical protein
MHCYTCLRAGSSKLQFLCPTDARNVLYEPRVENIRILLEKEALDRRITEIVSRDVKTTVDDTTFKNAPLEVTSRWDVERAAAEEQAAIDRTREIIAQADEFRAKIEQARAEIETRKAAISKRKSDLADSKARFEQKTAKLLDSIDKKIKMRKYQWNDMHRETALARAYLCGEAARLYGLRFVKSPDASSERYYIAGIPIMNLNSMNSHSAAQITTTLSHIAHLLILCTHYLTIRLPAEVTLPHRDYPLPTVLSVSSSYKYTNLPFPGSTPHHSSNNSPSASRHTEPISLPRSRPLFVTKPLPLLAKEDPSTYSLFLEGAALLAYDVAWVCKSQGVAVGTSTPPSPEDMFDIGTNLYNLLIGTGPPRPGPGSRMPSGTSTATTPSTTTSRPAASRRPTTDGIESGTDVEARKTPRAGLTKTAFGHYSHGTAHTSLLSADGNDFVRGFKLPSPMKLADKLKSKLLAEVSSAEWEVLEHPEIDSLSPGVEEGDGVVVGPSSRERDTGESNGPLGGYFGDAMQSFMSVRTMLGDAVDVVSGRERKPGTSGWTKVKPR